MNRRMSLLCLLPLIAAQFPFSASMAAEHGTTALTAEQVQTLFRGSTWAVQFGGGSDLVSVWDFNADGALCGRLRGDKPGTKCADTGKWRLHGDAICWDFTWLGETYNYKSFCARVRKADEKTYVLTDVSGKPVEIPIQLLTHAGKSRK